jgi:hypothetical protein
MLTISILAFFKRLRMEDCTLTMGKAIHTHALLPFVEC